MQNSAQLSRDLRVILTRNLSVHQSVLAVMVAAMFDPCPSRRCPQTVLFEASQDALSGKQNLNDSAVQEIGILGKEGILGKRQCDLLCLTWAKIRPNLR